MFARKTRTLLFLVLFSYGLKGQDTSEPWFPGGDPGFYHYLEDRLQSLGSQRPGIEQQGESVVFEFYVTDSGYVDSVRIGQCFNFQLCFQLRQILHTMPKLKPRLKNGNPIAERRVYVLDFKRYREGYYVEPSPYVPYNTATPAPQKLKWGIAVVAVVALLIVIFK